MSTKSAPFYWIECDAPGCTMRAPKDCSDFLAWATAEQAITDAESSEWSIGDAPNGKDFCPDHIPHGCDCDLLENPDSPPPCDEFNPTPNNPEFCITCTHVEECH